VLLAEIGGHGALGVAIKTVSNPENHQCEYPAMRSVATKLHDDDDVGAIAGYMDRKVQKVEFEFANEKPGCIELSASFKVRTCLLTAAMVTGHRATR
jgi:transcription antitermination factor NusA-like protein